MSRYLNVFYKFAENGASFSPSKMSYNFFQIDDNVRWKRIIFVRVVFVTFLFRKLNKVESILRTIDVAQGINQCIFSMYHKGDKGTERGLSEHSQTPFIYPRLPPLPNRSPDFSALLYNIGKICAISPSFRTLFRFTPEFLEQQNVASKKVQKSFRVQLNFNILNSISCVAILS